MELEDLQRLRQAKVWGNSELYTHYQSSKVQRLMFLDQIQGEQSTPSIHS